MKTLKYYKTDPKGKWVEFTKDIIKSNARWISFSLVYRPKNNSFWASVRDSRTWSDEIFNSIIEHVPHESAKFMIGAKEYNKLQKKHKISIKSSRKKNER